MEIEAKFSVPNEHTFQQLLGVGSLGGYSLGKSSVVDIYDRYLDTPDRAILSQGYACRLRRQGEQYLATVKGLGGVTGAIHRRIEYEVVLSGPLSPQDWPSSDARDVVQRVCGDRPLVPLFNVRQERHNRSLSASGRAVVRLSLDRGRIELDGTGRSVFPFLELEAELLAEQNEDILEELAVELQKTWGLVPESRSKFERALALSYLGHSLVPEGL